VLMHQQDLDGPVITKQLADRAAACADSSSGPLDLDSAMPRVGAAKLASSG
jgi:hypothetical protein